MQNVFVHYNYSIFNAENYKKFGDWDTSSEHFLSFINYSVFPVTIMVELVTNVFNYQGSLRFPMIPKIVEIDLFIQDKMSLQKTLVSKIPKCMHFLKPW